MKLTCDLESDILHDLSRGLPLNEEEADTTDLDTLLQQLTLLLSDLLTDVLPYLLTELGVLLKSLADSRLQLGAIIEELADSIDHISLLIEVVLCSCTRDSLDTTHTCGDGGLTRDAQRTDHARRGDVRTPTELSRRAKANDTDVIPILLPEESHSPHLASFVNGHLAVFLQRDAGTDTCCDDTLDSTELLGLDLRKVSEVKAQDLVRDE